MFLLEVYPKFDTKHNHLKQILDNFLEEKHSYYEQKKFKFNNHNFGEI